MVLSLVTFWKNYLLVFKVWVFIHYDPQTLFYVIIVLKQFITIQQDSSVIKHLIYEETIIQTTLI